MTDWRIWAEKINEDLRGMNVSWLGIPDVVLDALTEENADEVISSLSGPARESFLEWARRLSLSKDDDLFSYKTGDGKISAEQWRKIGVARAWVQAHPMPERSDPVPVDLVKGLLFRVDHENRRLIPLIQENRRHPERGRFDRTASVCADLRNALDVVTTHPSNPQAQAFAWDLLDRALRDVDGLVGVTDAEQRLIDLQKRARRVFG